jgi:hypothetical protein
MGGDFGLTKPESKGGSVSEQLGLWVADFGWAEVLPSSDIALLDDIVIDDEQ